jgi:DNA-binding response OmpR family regulator
MDRESILIVEAESGMTSTTRDVLGDAGYEVIVQDQAQDALASIRQNWPGLLLLAMYPPYWDATPLIHSIREDVRLRELPIIVLGDRTTKSYMLAVLDSGADDYLVKPMGSRELVARVGALLRRKNSTGWSERTVPSPSDDLASTHFDATSSDAGDEPYEDTNKWR